MTEKRKYLTCVDINNHKDYVIIEAASQQEADDLVWDRFLEDVQGHHEYWSEPLTDENLEKAEFDGFVTWECERD